MRYFGISDGCFRQLKGRDDAPTKQLLSVAFVASDDETVRVWDTAALREKTLSIGGAASDVFSSNDATVRGVARLKELVVFRRGSGTSSPLS